MELTSRLVSEVLARPALLGSGEHATRLVCIDGRAGAGKTTLAGALVPAFGEAGLTTSLVHMDDLYAGWGGLHEVRDVVVHDLIGPIAAGGTASYRHFDWVVDRYTHTVAVPAADVLLLEGCGCAPPQVDGVASLVVFVDAPDELRLARGLERDGEQARDLWHAFMADEDALAVRDRTRDRADVVLDEVGRVVRWPGGGRQGGAT